jgi:hypothetical protein
MEEEDEEDEEEEEEIGPARAGREIMGEGKECLDCKFDAVIPFATICLKGFIREET